MKATRVSAILALVLMPAFIGCHSTSASSGSDGLDVGAPNQLTRAERQAGWRLLFDGRRCIGATFTRGGRDYSVRVSRELVLCGGSIASPQLLQLSGVGAADHLRAIGVPVVLDLPGVGRNLSDHYAAAVTMRVKDAVTVNELPRGPRLALEVLRWIFAGNGALTFGATTASVFCRSHANLASPNLQLMFFPGSFDRVDIRALERDPGVHDRPDAPVRNGVVQARGSSGRGGRAAER